MAIKMKGKEKRDEHLFTIIGEMIALCLFTGMACRLNSISSLDKEAFECNVFFVILAVWLL